MSFQWPLEKTIYIERALTRDSNCGKIESIMGGD